MFDIFSFFHGNFDDVSDHSLEIDKMAHHDIVQPAIHKNEDLELDKVVNSFNLNYDYDSHVSINNGHISFGDVMIGDPYKDTQFVHMQEGINSCAVATQKEVLESFFGVDVPEIELSYMAYKNGWYDPSAGTMPSDIGKILESFGIQVERGYDYSISDICNALENGEKVIVGLNSNEIWNPQYDASGNPIEQSNAGHAIWVTGVYQDDSGNWFVVMNDSGIPDGAAEAVSIKDFLNAWNDFGNFAVITKTKQEGSDSQGLFAAQEFKDQISFGGYYYTGPNGERLYKAGDGHIYDVNGNKVG